MAGKTGAGDELPYETSEVFQCDGCSLTSSPQCRTDAKMDKIQICTWGKTKRVNKRGSASKNWNITKISLVGKKFKEEKGNGRKWKAGYKEYVNLRAGGTSRVRKMKNIVSKVVRGVAVVKGRKGVCKIKSGRRVTNKSAEIRDSGDMVLDAEQQEEAANEVAEEMNAEADHRGALTLEETQARAEAQRAAALEVQQGAFPDTADGGKASSDSEGSDDSDDSSEEGDDSSDEDSDRPPKKKAKQNASGGSRKAPAAASAAASVAADGEFEVEFHTPTPKKPMGSRVASVASGSLGPVKKMKKDSSELTGGHQKTLEDLSNLFEQIPTKLTNGDFDDTNGRALQRMVGDWHTTKRSGQAAVNHLLKQTDDEERRRVLSRFRNASDNIDPVAGYLRVFNLPGQAKATFQSMHTEWTNIKKLTQPPARGATAMLQKLSKEKTDATPSAISEILDIMSPTPKTDQVTTHVVRAADRAALHQDIIANLIGQIFKRRPFDARKDAENAEKVRFEIETEMTELLGKINDVAFANALGPQIIQTLQQILAVVHYAEESGAQLRIALGAWSNKAPDGILAQAAHSKVRGAFLKDAAEYLA
ncbi:unnamed protein product, partial [Prorocentrum cordatum]